MPKSLRTGQGIRRGGTQYETIHAALAKAAAHELADVGYADFMPESVALRAGVSARTAFRHYESKLALALAGIQSLPTYTGWLDARTPDESFADRLRNGLRSGVTYFELVGYIAASAVSFRESEPELLKALRNHVLVPRDKAIAKFLAEGQLAGVFRPGVQASALAAADLGIFTMVAIGQFTLGRGEIRVQRLFEQYWPLMALPDHLND